MHGQAVFADRSWGLHYEETGTLIMDGQPPMQASRRYRWVFSDGRVDVFFEDGRPFHHFGSDLDGTTARHLCGDDDYRVNYDFAGWPLWSARWRVTGPRKDYLMTTEYARER